MEPVHLWSGILSVQGQFACRVHMLSDATWNRPILVYVILLFLYLHLMNCGSADREFDFAEMNRDDDNCETCLNLTLKVNLEEGRRRWLCHMDQLNAKSEVYRDGWYICVTHLHSLDGREQFQKIVTYLERSNSLAVVKVGEDFLFLATKKQVNQQLDVERTKNDKTPFLYCICPSRQSVIIHMGKKPLRNSTFPVASQERTVVKMESSHQEYVDLEISLSIPSSSYLQASKIKDVFSVPDKSVVRAGEDPISSGDAYTSVSLCQGDQAECKDLEYNDKRSISSSLLSSYSLKYASKKRKTERVHITKGIEDDTDECSANIYKENWHSHHDRKNKQAASLVGTNKRTRTNSAKENVSQNNDTIVPIMHKKVPNATPPLTRKHKWNMESSSPVAKEKNAKKGRVKSWVKANMGKCASTSASVAASLNYALAGQEPIQFGVPREVLALKKIPKRNSVTDRSQETLDKLCSASEVGLEMLADQVVLPGMEKQEKPCMVKSASSLDVAPTEEDSLFTQMLHDNKIDLDNQNSGLNLVSSTQSEADMLKRREAVRTVRMSRMLECHIINNIDIAFKFPYIEANLCHTVRAVLQGPVSGYSCSDAESLIYQSVSSSLHGNQSEGRICKKKVRVDMTSIPSICAGDIFVDLHYCSNIIRGESDGQADGTVDDKKCDSTGIDIVSRKTRSEEDGQHEELDVHRINDGHDNFPGKEQNASGEDDQMRNTARVFLPSKAISSKGGENTPCEISSIDAKHILSLVQGENTSCLTSEFKENNKEYAELNGISDTTPTVGSERDPLQRSHNELAVASGQSLGNNKWLELKAEAEAVHEVLLGQADIASSHSSLFQAAHFDDKPQKVNYASVQQQQQTEVVSPIESRGQHDEICDSSVIGTSSSTSSVSQVYAVAQSENEPCVSSPQQIKTVPQTQSALTSLSGAITSSHTSSITTCTGSQANKFESLTAVAVHTLSQGNSVSLNQSSESENKIQNSKKLHTVTVTVHTSESGHSAEMIASFLSLRDDRSEASSHEQKAGRSKKLEDSKRSHRQDRQFHPYKKQEKKRKDPSWSFDTPYRDLAELLQNLTSKTYKQSSKAPRETNSWKRPSSQPSRRFSSFRFCRSEVPLTLPRSGSPSCEDDLNALTPNMIPNFEERHRTAELLEELFASRDEETYNKEESTYQREQKDIQDDPLPAFYPVFEKSKKLMVIKDDTEISFIQDQTDLQMPGSRTTLFSRTHLSDMSVGDEDKIEVDSRDTDTYPMDEDINDYEDKTFPKESTTQMQDKNDKKDKTFPKDSTTQMQDKNDQKNKTFPKESKSLVKDPGLASEVAMDCFPDVVSLPMLEMNTKDGNEICQYQHTSKTRLESKKSEELLSRQLISRISLDNVKMNTCGCSEKSAMEDADVVNYISAIIGGKQIQSTFSQTHTPLKCVQTNYEETKSQGSIDMLRQGLIQTESQNNVFHELTNNYQKRGSIHDKRDKAAQGSGTRQQNQFLATADIGSNRDCVSSMTTKSAQSTVHENEIEHSSTGEKYNSKSHHSCAGRTLTNRNMFSLFETKFFKNENSATVNVFDFSPILIGSKQRSVESETETRKEVSVSELFSKNHCIQEPKFAIDDALISSVLENKQAFSAADASSVNFGLNSNTAWSLIEKHDAEDESCIESQLVNRNTETKIPEVDAATDNDSVNQCQLSDLGQDVNGEICSYVKRPQVHCSFYRAVVGDSQKGYNKNVHALEKHCDQNHIGSKEQCKISAEEKDRNSQGSLEVAQIANLNAEQFDESVLSFKMIDVSSHADSEESALSATAEVQVDTGPDNELERTSLLTIKGHKDVESLGSKDSANGINMRLQREMNLTHRPSYRQQTNLVGETEEFAEQTVSSPDEDNFALSCAITSALKGKEIESVVRVLEDYSGKLSDEKEELETVSDLQKQLRQAEDDPVTGRKIQTDKWNTIVTTPASTNDSITGVKQLNKTLLNIINDMDPSRQVCSNHLEVSLDTDLNKLTDFNPCLTFEFQREETQDSSVHQVQVECFFCPQDNLDSSVTKKNMPCSSHSAYRNVTQRNSSYSSENQEFCVILSGSCKEYSKEAENSDCSQPTPHHKHICSKSKVQGSDEVLKQSNGTLSYIVKDSDTIQGDFSVGLGSDKVSCEHTSLSKSSGVKNTYSDPGLELSGVHGSWSWIYDVSNIRPSVDNQSTTCFATPVYLTAKPDQITASFATSVSKIKEMYSSSQQEKIIQYSDATIKEDEVAALTPKENSVVCNMNCSRESATKDGGNSKLCLLTESYKKSGTQNARQATKANTWTSKDKLGPLLDVDGKIKKLARSRIDQYPDLKLIGSKRNEFPIKVSTARRNIQKAVPSLISKEIKSAGVKCFGENIQSSAETGGRNTPLIRDDERSIRKRNKVKKGSSEIDSELKKFYDEVKPLLNCLEQVVPAEKCGTQLPKETFSLYKSLVNNKQELLKKPASKYINDKSAESEKKNLDTNQYKAEESIHKNSADVANTQKMSIDLSDKDKACFFMSNITPLEMIFSNYNSEEEGDLEKANRSHECLASLTLDIAVENDLSQGANDTSNRVQESCDKTLTGTKDVTSCISTEKNYRGTSNVSCTYTDKSSNVMVETLVCKCSPGKETPICIMPEIHHCDPSLMRAGKSKQQTSSLATKIHTSALHSIFSNYYLNDLEVNGPKTVDPTKQSTRDSISNDPTENNLKTSVKGNLAPKGDDASSSSTRDQPNNVESCSKHLCDQEITTQQDPTVKGSDKLWCDMTKQKTLCSVCYSAETFSELDASGQKEVISASQVLIMEDPLTHEQEVRMAKSSPSQISTCNPSQNVHLKLPRIACDEKLVTSEGKPALKFSKVERDREEEEKAMIGSCVDTELKDWSDPQNLNDRILENPEDDRILDNVGNDVLAKDSDSDRLKENSDNRLAKNPDSDGFAENPDGDSFFKQSLDIQVTHVNKYNHHLPQILSAKMNISGHDSAVKRGSETIKESSSITYVCSDDVRFSGKTFTPLKKKDIVKKTLKTFSGFKSSETCFLSQGRQIAYYFENFVIRKDRSGRRVFFVSQSRSQSRGERHQTQKNNLYSGVCGLFAPGVYVPDVKSVATKTCDTKIREHHPECKRDEHLKSERKLLSENSFQSGKKSVCTENSSSCVDFLSKNRVACSGNANLDSPHEENGLSVQIHSDTQDQNSREVLNLSEIRRLYEKSSQSDYKEVRKVSLENGATKGNSCTSLVTNIEIYSPSQYSKEHQPFHDKKNNVSLDSSKCERTGYCDIVTVANIEKNRKCKLPKEFLPPCEPQYNHKCEQSTSDSMCYPKTHLQIASASFSKQHPFTGDSYSSHSISSDKVSVKNERNSMKIYVTKFDCNIRPFDKDSLSVCEDKGTVPVLRDNDKYAHLQGPRDIRLAFSAHGKDATYSISGSYWSTSSHQEPCSSQRASVRPCGTEISLRNRHSEKLLRQLKYTTGGFVLLDDSVIKPSPKTVEELSEILQALQGIITKESLWIVGIHAVQICNLAEQRLSEGKRLYADQLLSLFSSFRHSCLVKLLQNHSCDAMECRMTSDLVQCAKTFHVKEGRLQAYVLTTIDTEDDPNGTVRICSLQTFTDLLGAIKEIHFG